MTGRRLATIATLLLGSLAQAAVAAEPPSTATPAATPLPAADRAAILATLDQLFAALEAGDGAALLARVDPDGRITATGQRADGTSGVRRLSFTEYAARMKLGQGFIERITSPTIAIDDDIAMVWAPFTIHRQGKVASCGYDHFDLVRDGGGWKVANLTFSSRNSGCVTPAE